MRLTISLLALLALPAATRAQVATPEPPALVNRDAVAAAIGREYPPSLLKQQLGSIIRVRLHVTADGAVDSARVASPGGDAQTDSAALRVARVMRFRPARRGGEPVAIWVVVPVEFQVEAASMPDVLKYGKPVRLELLNGPTVRAAMRGRYPDAVRQAGLRARLVLRLAVGSAGLVRSVAVDTSSCMDYFDRIGQELVGLMRFAPDPTGDTAVQRVTSVALLFAPDSGTIQLPGDSVPRHRNWSELGQQRRAPELVNRQAVLGLLRANYPPELGAAGVGGDALYWILVDEEGKVAASEIERTSGSCALDLSALRVIQGMRFSPALLDGRPQKVWIEMPFTWRTR